MVTEHFDEVIVYANLIKTANWELESSLNLPGIFSNSLAARYPNAPIIF